MPYWSEHARIRAYQRKVTQQQAELTLVFGSEHPQVDQKRIYHLGVHEARVARQAGVFVEGALGLAVVLGEDDTIVTVFRCDRSSRLRAPVGVAA